MRRSALIALLAAAGLAACGQTGGAEFEGTEREVAETVDDISEAARTGDEEQLCSTLLAPALTRRPGGCRRVVAQALDDADDFTLDVVRVRVQGTSATARVAAGAGDAKRGVDLRFVREGRNWKLADLT